jgi:membrane peptidoglycan carboxypeptidase
MSSYGEPQSSSARARVPATGGSTPDDDQAAYPAAARPAPDAYRRGAAGRASVGNAPVGSVTAGRASVGGAPVGTASVRVGGRASIGGAPVPPGSRPVVARAAVRPAAGFGAPGGPGDLPPGGGPGRSGGAGGAGRSKAAKRRRRTNILTAAAAVLVIMLGAGVVGGTYFFDDVALPNPVSEDQSNVILNSDGKTVLAKLGDQNRTVVPEPKINEIVEHAVAAAEDKNFYTHHGIDMKGIVRAAWNNFTGGDTQGASTITQQYARHAAELKAITINRKLREAVIARKLESKYDKHQIMGMYLNYIYLGQGRYGIEAAAQGYFGKSVMTPAGSKNAITPYEAAVLASIIKQPEKSATYAGYDPTVNPEGAKVRWEYTMANMLEMKWISPEVYAARKYPDVKKASSQTCAACKLDKPVDMVVRHVRAELAAMGISKDQFDKGGLTVTTTIDPDVQKAAEAAGSGKSKDSPMYGRPKTYQAAVIGIDPRNGRVLGYYAGNDPNGIDYGGYMTGDGSKITGGQSPGSSMKIYTLAAALQADISFQTTWDGTKLRPNGKPINNAGAETTTLCDKKVKFCPLEEATIQSYNFPFYWIANNIGREKVISAAKAAGLKHMFTDTTVPNAATATGCSATKKTCVDLTKTDSTTWKKTGYFDNEVAFGQYQVVPLEHAEGVATIVAGGVHHAAHFIKSIKTVDADTGKTTIVNTESKVAPAAGNRVFPEDQMSNLQGVMKKIVIKDDRNLDNGREAIAKSGTWEEGEGSGDCWFVGGIPQLAATVWVGGAKNRVELKESNGHDMFGAGTPSRIWRQFLNASAKALDMDKEEFPPRQNTGDPNSKFANGQTPPPVQPQNNCFLGFIGEGCDNNNGNNNGGNNNGNNNGGNNNGGNTGNGDTGTGTGTGTGTATTGTATTLPTFAATAGPGDTGG